MDNNKTTRERACITCGACVGSFTNREWVYHDQECALCAYEADRDGGEKGVAGTWVPDKE